MNQEISSNSAPSVTGLPQKTAALNSSFKSISGRITQIQREMQKQQTPRQLAENRATLASFYGYLTHQLANLEAARNSWWSIHREAYKSDTACDRAWSGTDMGELAMRIRYELKALDKMISSLRTLLDVTQSELRNQI